MQYIVKLTDSDGRVDYRAGEPGSGGTTNEPERAQRFDTRAEAEAYVGRLVTHKGLLVYNSERVSIEEYSPSVELSITPETAQFIRNFIGYIDFWQPNVVELRNKLSKAGFSYEAGRFDVTAGGIEPVKGVR